jgi:ribosomal protein S18 acetylase RimI-like enzyme
MLNLFGKGFQNPSQKIGKMKIRKLIKKDLKPLYKFGFEEFGKEEWFSKKFLEDSFKRDCISFVAVENKKIIGSIMIDFLDKPKAWIFFMLVEKGFREKGVGSMLLKEAEGEIPRGYYSLLVDFEKTDKSARKFYKEHEFREVANIKNWFGRKHRGLIYEKVLKN